MIAAVVSEFQLECLSAQRDARELMPQADSENRLAAHQAANRVDRIRTWFRIAGAVRQEDSIRLQCEYIFRWSLRRNDGDFASLTAQLAQNVLLDSEVIGDHVKSRRLVFYSDYSDRLVGALANFPHVRALRADHLRQIRPV